jgi:hypothetical protein
MRGVGAFAILGCIALGALLVVWRWLRRQSALRRATPSTAAADIDAAWLERHVFSWSPELVGAAYDGRIGGAEVAAVLARMCGEAKLASRVASGARGWNNLELWLLVEREELTGYERELVDRLFITGKTTSADLIQREYGPRGFEPAAILRRHLSRECDAALGLRPTFRWMRWLAWESAKGLALRHDLRAARRFFAAELERPEPRLRDEWLPYLVSLELTVEVDRWHQAFGRIDTAARKQRPTAATERAPGDGAATSAVPSAWTGGGGALGGRGACGPWIAATAGLTVPAPSQRRRSDRQLQRLERSDPFPHSDRRISTLAL